MLDEQLVYLENQVDLLDKLIKENDFGALDKGFAEFDKNLRAFFDSEGFDSSDHVNALLKINYKLGEVLLSAKEQKKTLANQLGSHLKNQKKLDVYKSIK
ncbi:hypothetical protein [Pseudoalteromonas sp.]|uniref:hypothetical protein n=1 Tax=Pseudoalteromonas sp. TaxID=53249 RepID=UPI0035167825